MAKEQYQGMADHDLLVHLATKQEGITEEFARNDKEHDELFNKTNKNSNRISWLSGGVAAIGALAIIAAIIAGVVAG